MLGYMMKSAASWMVFLGVLARHPLYRAGLTRRPMFTDHYDASQRAWGQATRWNPRLRVVHGERCPAAHPAIFAGNHAKLDDPFFIWRAVHRSTGEGMHCRFVMRDDWGQGGLWRLFPIPFNELGEMAGAVPISRGNVQYSQMKPLVQILQQPGSFIIFPGRTRSRSGMMFEYREGIEDPGGTSFFIATGQRKMPGVRIPAVPVARTHNPITWRSTVVFGEPMYLAEGAGRQEQREFDYQLVQRIGELVELNMLHVVCALLYFHCLHAPGAKMLSAVRLQEAAAAVFDRKPHEYVAPEVGEHFEQEFERVLAWLQRQGVVRRSGDELRVEVARVLRAPELDSGYRKSNPVKYQANQVLHLSRVVEAVEAVALARL